MTTRAKAGRARGVSRVERLADELFRQVEEAQGHAFISDAEGAGMDEQQFFDRVRGRLDWTEKSATLIRDFLVKNAPMRPASRKPRGGGRWQQ